MNKHKYVNNEIYCIFAIGYFKMLLYNIYSFCSCDDSKQKYFDDDLFPNTYQIWGMMGTILTTIACWIIYSKVDMTKFCIILFFLNIPAAIGKRNFLSLCKPRQNNINK